MLRTPFLVLKEPPIPSEAGWGGSSMNEWEGKQVSRHGAGGGGKLWRGTSFFPSPHLTP